MIAPKQFTGGVKEEYETQYYDFGSQTLQIAVRQMIEDNISSRIQNMGARLQETLKLDEDGEKAIADGCDKLTRLYCERADASIKTIDEAIENFLNIPSNAVLAEDEAQLRQYTEEEHETLKREVADLQARLKRATVMELALREEDNEITEFEEMYKLASQAMETVDVLSKSVCESTKMCACVVADSARLASQMPGISQNLGRDVK